MTTIATTAPVPVVGAGGPRIDSDLVISGAGSHGLTEAAALSVLSHAIRFVRVGGASAGAINAAGLAFGFTPEYMVGVWTRLLTRGDLEDWKFPGPLKPLGMLSGRGGCMKGEVIRAALRDVFSTARMGDAVLPLRIKVGGMARRRTETVYSDAEIHRKLFVVDAVMCSLAVPVLIDNQQLDPPRPAVRGVGGSRGSVIEPEHRGSPELYCDGGTGDNVPRALWDDELQRPTTVVRFLDDETPIPVTDLKSRIRAYINILRDASEDEPSRKPVDLVWDIAIKADGDALDFSLDAKECARREQAGQDAARKWLVERERAVNGARGTPSAASAASVASAVADRVADRGAKS